MTDMQHPTSAPSGEYNHAAMFARNDSHLHRELLSLPANICCPYPHGDYSIYNKDFYHSGLCNTVKNI